MKRVVVASSTDVTESKLLPVTAEGHALLLTRVGGKLCAVSGKCPHLGLSMAGGTVDGGTLRCPWHGSRFDLRTGANVAWVNSLMRMPLPKWASGALAMGKEPTTLPVYEATESSGSVSVTIPD